MTVWGVLQARCKQEKAIVYFLTCACVDLHAAVLGQLPGLEGIPVQALHGRMKQAAREATLESFAALPSGEALTTTPPWPGQSSQSQPFNGHDMHAIHRVDGTQACIYRAMLQLSILNPGT